MSLLEAGRCNGIRNAKKIVQEHARFFEAVSEGRHPAQAHLRDGTVIMYSDVTCVPQSCLNVLGSVYSALNALEEISLHTPSGRMSVMRGDGEG